MAQRASGFRWDGRSLRAAAMTFVVIAAVSGVGAAAGATTPQEGTRVRGSLLLVGRDHWSPKGERACVGAGLYGDVRRGMHVLVRDEQGTILTRTVLGSGRRETSGCRLSFAVTLPHSDVYTFEIGHRGAVYQESYDDDGLSYVHRRLSFVVP